MKLQDITATFNPTSRIHHTGSIIVDAIVGSELRKHLFDLIDYMVTSCTGDTVWLRPRHIECGVPYGN